MAETTERSSSGSNSLLTSSNNCCSLNSISRRNGRNIRLNRCASVLWNKRLYPSWLLWWLMLLWAPRLTVASHVPQQQFRRTPDNQTATLGDTVTLACSVINKIGTLQWTRDGFGMGVDRSLVGYDRYRMIGSEEEGDYTLVIDHVTLEDDAIFQCQVGPADGARELRSANAKLTVEVPTGVPEIIQGDFLQTTEDREIQLECISRGGKPAAEITWIDGSGQEIKSGVETVKEPLDDGKRFNARSILRLRPKKEHHNKTFTCQAHNRPAKEVMSAFIRLEVKYAPKVTVKILSPKIQEYDSVRVSCRAEANPPTTTYRWFKNDQVQNADGTVLILQNVTRSDHNAIIKCEVSNQVGKSEESETLDIKYGPVFRNRPRNVQADLGSMVTLSCDVDGNPPPEIVWFHQETRTAVKTSPNFTTTVTKDTEGKYICQAVVQGFPQVSAEAMIFLKGAPEIKSQKLQFGTEGDTVRLECLAISIPKPDRITWTHLGREIDKDLNDPDYSILDTPLPNGVRSVLVIRTSQEKDFGPYNCSVTNPYGTHVKEIYLMKQKSGQLVIILTCVIGGVVIIVAITMITLLCQRKSRKPDLMDVDGVEKQTKQSDRSSNDSDLKVEIRTASSLSNMPEHDSEHWDDGGSDNKNESIYNRYSDYIEPVFPPKADGHNNNGYVPYVDYSRDYNPPHARNSLYSGVGPPISGVMPLQSPQYLNNVDPRYSATYGNPYLRTSNTSLPPPHSAANAGNHSPNGKYSPTSGAHPLTHSAVHHNHHNHNHTNHITHNHIGTPTSAAPPPLATSPHSHSHTNSLSNSTGNNPYGMRNGGVPQPVPRVSSTPSPQYIVPSQPQLKPGTLATHV